MPCFNIILAFIPQDFLTRQPRNVRMDCIGALCLLIQEANLRPVKCVVRAGSKEGQQFPVQPEQLRSIFEGVAAYSTGLILRQIIKGARRARLCTSVVGRARTRGMFGPLSVHLFQRGDRLIRIRPFSPGGEPAQQRSPKPFNLVGSGFLYFFNVTRLIGFLVLSKIECVVEQETDLCYCRRAVREFMTVQEQRLVNWWDVKFFIDLDGIT